MKSILRFSALSLVIFMLLYISCKKEFSCEGCINGNKPPISNAGPEQVITLPTDSVLLDGTQSSDPDGTISSYGWTKISGPASFAITSSSVAKPVVKNLITGTYRFELKVTDNGGLSAKDTMQVIIDNPAINQPPVAKAGADQTINLPTDSVLLDGSTSFDLDGTITLYKWIKIAGPVSFSIIEPDSAKTPAKTLIVGIYQFELSVTDNGGLISKDTVQIIVDAVVSNNIPPVARAGNDTTIQTNQTSCTPVPITITLNGSNSYDTDGTITTYSWIGPGNIVNSNTAITTVTGLTTGIYLFYLKVTDNNGTDDYDTIKIMIHPVNRPFVSVQLIPMHTLSEPRMGISVGAAGNKIVFAGNSELNSSSVDIYDIVTQAWSTAQLSSPRNEITTVSSGNKIFFAGGWNKDGTDPLANVDIYDASTNSWSVSFLSEPKVWLAATSLGSKVFFGGGYKAAGFQVSNKVEIYDAISHQWSIANLSQGRDFMTAEAIGNKIYFAGGNTGYASTPNALFAYPTNRIDIYDVATDSWSIDSLSEAKYAFASIVAGNKIYWAGGITNASSIPSIASSRIDIKNIATQSVSFDCLFQVNADFKAVRKGNKIVFFTGNGGFGSVTDKFDIYDITTDTWSIGVLPVSIMFASIISVNNVIYVAGGNVNGVFSNMVWKLEF